MRFAHLLRAVCFVVVTAAMVGLTGCGGHPAAEDPRTSAPLVKTAIALQATGSTRSFTGSVGARVQSNLGFRVSGKITARLVDVGQHVKRGQPLMRIDGNDLRLAVEAKNNSVAAARAAMVQAEADDKRYARLSKELFAEPPQRYEQAKAIYDASAAQLAAAEAQASIAQNEASYVVLQADADGTVVEALGEPGQVVAAGQTVVRLAHAGPREAVVALPETVHPTLGSIADASVYGSGRKPSPARLRQLSESADPQTRTYEARYVLDGEAAQAPLGATVTIRLPTDGDRRDVEIPVGALYDGGHTAGVWVVDATNSVVHFTPVSVHRVGEETAAVSGLAVGDLVVALGAHLLREGESVRTVARTVSAL